MVEINNQRKAFLDMLAWSRTRIRWKRNHGYDVIVGGELFTDYSGSPSQTCHAKPKLKSLFPTLPASFLLVDAYRKQLGLKDSSPKSQTLWHCSRLRSVALYLWLIVVISVRQSTVAAISGLHCRALVMVSSSMGSRQPDCKIQKEAGGTVREMDVWAESPRLSPLWLSAWSSACHGLLIITGVTPLPTKLSDDKNARELKLANAAITDMPQMRHVMLCRCKIHEGVIDAKAENQPLPAWWCCRWSSSVAHQQSVSQCEATIASGVDNAASPDWQTPLNLGLFHPQREADQYAKTTGRNPEVY